MIKFRTMKLCSKQEGDPYWTSANDPRRTLIGAFLRKVNLDELPQFFNVLTGHMSIVGRDRSVRILWRGSLSKLKGITPGICSSWVLPAGRK